MTLAPTDRSKDTLKKHEELWNKIRDLIRSITNNNFDEQYIKVKSDSDDALPLKKTLELYNMIIVVMSIFHEGSKYYRQVFLDECLYKLEILEYDGIDMSERSDFGRINGSRKCSICHYHHFLKVNFRF